MSQTAKLELNGKNYEFPIVQGSENEQGIDISTLLVRSGAVVLDEGYRNTASCRSAITLSMAIKDFAVSMLDPY